MLEQVGPGLARARFDGRFRGQPVVWEATVVTLEQHRREGAEETKRALIDVRRVADGHGELLVVLPLPAIDGPALLKTAIMIRQWKRLELGRHEYGPVVGTSSHPAGSD